MDSDSPKLAGLDIVGAECRLAIIEKAASKPHIISLQCQQIDTLFIDSNLSGLAFVLAVPDDIVLVKEVDAVQPESDRFDEQIKFEIRQLLLDDPEEFCFDIVKTNNRSNFLGLVARQEKLASFWNDHNDGRSNLPKPEGYVMRAAALGRGYLHFCVNDKDGVVALIDFSNSLASFCIVYEKQLVALGYFDCSGYEINSNTYWFKVAAELKTLLNFRLNALSKKGITPALSALVATGDKIDNKGKEILAGQLSIEIMEPRIIESNAKDIEHHPADLISQYLIPLGLTVE